MVDSLISETSILVYLRWVPFSRDKAKVSVQDLFGSLPLKDRLAKFPKAVFSLNSMADLCLHMLCKWLRYVLCQCSWSVALQRLTIITIAVIRHWPSLYGSPFSEKIKVLSNWSWCLLYSDSLVVSIIDFLSLRMELRSHVFSSPVSSLRVQAISSYLRKLH